ncbi:MAG: hydroxyisourate hydrolase [Chitinophagaceae bacterium]
MSQLTTHILDTTSGLPARGVSVVLFRQQNGNWQEIAKGVTNDDGRIPSLLKEDMVLQTDTYKMRFETKDYFDKQNRIGFYPFIEIIFSVTTAGHYHIPLLLSPFGYSTYRGS